MKDLYTKIKDNDPCKCGRRRGDGFNDECNGDLCQYYLSEQSEMEKLDRNELIPAVNKAVRFDIQITGIDILKNRQNVCHAVGLFNSQRVRDAIDNLIDAIQTEISVEGLTFENYFIRE